MGIGDSVSAEAIHRLTGDSTRRASLPPIAEISASGTAAVLGAEAGDVAPAGNRPAAPAGTADDRAEFRFAIVSVSRVGTMGLSKRRTDDKLDRASAGKA